MWSRLYNSRLSARRSSGNADRSVLLVGPAYLNNAFTTTNANGTRRNASGLIESVAANTPRFDHDVNGTLLGLLVEESRTNLLTWSEAFDNAAWTKTRSSITADAAIAPDGEMTADKLVEDATASSTHLVSRSLSLTSGDTHTESVFAKQGERSFVAIQFNSGFFSAGGARNAIWNLETGQLHGTTGTIVASSIEDFGDGWYRCSLTVQVSVTTTDNSNIHMADDSGNLVYSGDGTSGIYIWGAQLEEGSFATSYIPTTTAAVTRNADDIVDSTISWFNASAWSMFVEFASNSVRPSTQDLFSLTDGTSAETFRAGLLTNTNVFFEPKDASVSQALLIPGQSAAGSSGKLAVSAEENNFAAALDGGTPVADTSGTLPAVTELNLGQTNGASNFLNGHIKTLRYYNSRLTNAQLQSMTA